MLAPSLFTDAGTKKVAYSRFLADDMAATDNSKDTLTSTS